MGLNSKESVVVVKEEPVEGGKESAFLKGSGVQWPTSSVPHFITFKAAQEEKTAKVTSDPAASGFIAISTGDVYDATQKRPSGETQNFAGATMKQQLFGGIPLTLGSVAGSTGQWFSSKASGAPAQLTIFYGGRVNVFDDISPEKAQAIMLLAGNWSVNASNMAQPRAQVHVPTIKKAAENGVQVNQQTNTPASSALSSPMSVSSHPVGQSGSGTSTDDEMMAFKPAGVMSTSVSKVDPPKIAVSRGPIAATTMISSAVPQARKASLARFLEKRKERAMNSAPYNLINKSPECATPGSNDVGAGAAASLSTNQERGYDL